MIDVEVLRSFNRCYSQRIGVLAESYLGTGRSLGLSRLLFEIGSQGARVGDLRRRLDLDSGYLSRLLRQLEQDDLVTVAPDPVDARQRVAELSASGRREWKRLDRRADELARRLLSPLTERQQRELAEALATAERLLRSATVDIDTVDPRSHLARTALEQYYRELDERFRTGFDPDAGGAAELDGMRSPAGAFLIMRTDQAVLGCGGVQHLDDNTAEIKRMWIHPAWRGLGLGGRLLSQLEHVAAGLGRTRVLLDTNETLSEAIAMYQRAGYDAIPRYNDNPYAHHWFAKNV